MTIRRGDYFRKWKGGSRTESATGPGKARAVVVARMRRFWTWFRAPFNVGAWFAFPCELPLPLPCRWKIRISSKKDAALSIRTGLVR
jgi:hypothetical protein